MNKKNLLTSTALIITLGLFMGNCDKKVGKLEGSAPPPVGLCDTITFTKHIKPIIEQNCSTIGCHVSGGSGNGDFTSFSELKSKVTAGTFKLRVFDSPNNPMPASGKLPQKQLDVIQCWLDKGALND